MSFTLLYISFSFAKRGKSPLKHGKGIPIIKSDCFSESRLEGIATAVDLLCKTIFIKCFLRTILYWMSPLVLETLTGSTALGYYNCDETGWE